MKPFASMPRIEKAARYVGGLALCGVMGVAEFALALLAVFLILQAKAGQAQTWTGEWGGQCARHLQCTMTLQPQGNPNTYRVGFILATADPSESLICKETGFIAEVQPGRLIGQFVFRHGRLTPL